MAGGRDAFLNELDGDFVKYLRADPVLGPMIGGTNENARIFSEAARQGAPMPYLVYTQAAGNWEKHLGGLDGCVNLILHVYCYSTSQPTSRNLAAMVCNRMLPTQAIVADGTKLYVCNGGVVDSGVNYDMASGDEKKFWTRVLLRMVIGD
jgi:hypothetical protein